MTPALIASCAGGIVFRADDVRAIREGRKTRFTVPLNPQPNTTDPTTYADLYHHEPNHWSFWLPDGRMTEPLIWIPRHLPGQRYYVRETWARVMDGEPPYSDDGPSHFEYRADSGDKYPGEWPDDCGDDPECGRWKSSTCMPRTASRYVIAIDNVKAMRLQDIWVFSYAFHLVKP